MFIQGQGRGWQQVAPADPTPTPPMPKKDTIMITLAGGEYARHTDLIAQNHGAFCECNGFDYSLIDSKFDHSRNWSWNKIPAIKHALYQYKRVIWCDADCFTLQPTRILEFDGKPIQCSVDYNGWCCGFMVVRNEALAFIKAWETLGPLSNPLSGDTRDTWEQSSFKFLQDNFPKISDITQPIGENIVANKNTRGLSDPPAFFHEWGGGRGVPDDLVHDIQSASTESFCDERQLLERTKQDAPDNV